MTETVDTRTAIIAAASTLLAEHGARALTTRAVADAAGVQAPTIYRFFGDKDGLVDAVAEHAMATYVAAKPTHADEPNPVAALRAGWRMQIDFGLANPELHSLLHAPGRPRTAADEAGLAMLRERVRRLAAAGILQVSEDRALAMIRAAGVGAITTLLATPLAQRDLGLPDAVFDALIATITTGATTAPSDDVAVLNGFATVVPRLSALSDGERTLLAEWVERSILAAQRG